MSDSNRLDVYTIIENAQLDKSYWVKVGAAFKNRDGSINVFLDAFPANGKLHIRARKTEGEDK